MRLPKCVPEEFYLMKKLEDVSPPLSQNDVFSQSMIEGYIRGMSSSSHEPQLQVTASPHLGSLSTTWTNPRAI